MTVDDSEEFVSGMFVYDTPADARFHLKMFAHNGWGATYKTNIDVVPQVWLCNVTKVVFGGKHPINIYLK